MGKVVTLIMCVWMLASCQESREETILRLVNEWNGKEIKFPARSVFTIQGRDTVDFELKDADYKVVMYIDSAGCTNCKLQLHRWKELVAEVDSLTDGRVPFLFYFHPKDRKELRYLTRRDDFTYPVCFDEQDELNRLNRFPSDMTFQTFLLDKENKVVAMGSPVLNPKVKELYLGLITGSRSAKAQSIVTQVSVNQTELDFGSFPKDEKQERSFMLTNTGKQQLVVHDVVTSCGCTKVEYSKQPVRPGETLELKVIYEAEDTGHFNKTVTVYCNVENSPLRLKVKGTANSDEKWQSLSYEYYHIELPTDWGFKFGGKDMNSIHKRVISVKNDKGERVDYELGTLQWVSAGDFKESMSMEIRSFRKASGDKTSLDEVLGKIPEGSWPEYLKIVKKEEGNDKGSIWKNLLLKGESHGFSVTVGAFTIMLWEYMFFLEKDGMVYCINVTIPDSRHSSSPDYDKMARRIIKSFEVK